jgi:hypothetical protein
MPSEFNTADDVRELAAPLRQIAAILFVEDGVFVPAHAGFTPKHHRERFAIEMRFPDVGRAVLNRPRPAVLLAGRDAALAMVAEMVLAGDGPVIG